MKELLINALEKVCKDVYLQGTLEEDREYPETFITFWTYDVPEGTHYDNEAHSFNWSYNVNIYSSNPSDVAAKAEEARRELKKAGFIVDGKGEDLPSDIPTHTGWALDVVYHETI